MRKPKSSSNRTREAVLAELAQLGEGRYPNCQTVTARFMRSDEWKEASIILREAIEGESFNRASSVISAPPGWLLPV